MQFKRRSCSTARRALERRRGLDAAPVVHRSTHWTQFPFQHGLESMHPSLLLARDGLTRVKPFHQAEPGTRIAEPQNPRTVGEFQHEHFNSCFHSVSLALEAMFCQYPIQGFRAGVAVSARALAEPPARNRPQLGLRSACRQPYSWCGCCSGHQCRIFGAKIVARGFVPPARRDSARPYSFRRLRPAHFGIRGCADSARILAPLEARGHFKLLGLVCIGVRVLHGTFSLAPFPTGPERRPYFGGSLCCTRGLPYHL